MTEPALSHDQPGSVPAPVVAPMAPDLPTAPTLVASLADPVVTPGPMLPPRMLDELDLRSARRRRRLGLPLVLFIATCGTTFLAGVGGWKSLALDTPLGQQIAHDGWRGLQYMLAVMAVLLAHEMGHFLMTVRYAIPSSYPLFIPMPVGITGTLGAVISMDGLRANRRQLFDIGLAGPLAGLVLTIPLVCIGIHNADRIPGGAQAVAVENPGEQPKIHFGQPLLVKLLLPYLQPTWPADSEFEINAFYMAGWVGMLITGLNMMPVSQLDGGHIIYALFRRDGRRLARAFLLSAIAATIIGENYFYAVMLILVIVLGVDHPATANDHVRLGPVRWTLGVLSLAIPILCFTPRLIWPL
jgi:Zn-dependent protease